MKSSPQTNPPPSPPEGGRWGAVLLLTAVYGLLTTGCTQYYTLDLPDVNFEQPDDLDQRLKDYRSGAERYHGDPRAVADLAIKSCRKFDVPWRAEPFRPSQYSIKESDDWGTFVVRGYVYPSGNLMRYRVKVRAFKEIWYPVQISRYKMYTIEEDSAHILH